MGDPSDVSCDDVRVSGNFCFQCRGMEFRCLVKLYGRWICLRRARVKVGVQSVKTKKRGKLTS